MPTAAQQNNPAAPIPPLVAGDRLTRDEFERRYHAMTEVRRAELIEGVVYMPSPVSHARHGRPHSRINGWLFQYEAHTPGVESGNNSTIRLDLDNEVQPDVFLRILPSCGGVSRDTADGYLEGAPELVVEVTASSAAYDFHDKLHAYRRNGVLEYLIWRVDDRELDWFARRGGQFERLAQASDRLVRSEAFPGLWLHVEALLTDDSTSLLATLSSGTDSPEHRRSEADLLRTRRCCATWRRSCGASCRAAIRCSSTLARAPTTCRPTCARR
jgi:Uma2 family endonuclease